MNLQQVIRDWLSAMVCDWITADADDRSELSEVKLSGPSGLKCNLGLSGGLLCRYYVFA